MSFNKKSTTTFAFYDKNKKELFTLSKLRLKLKINIKEFQYYYIFKIQYILLPIFFTSLKFKNIEKSLSLEFFPGFIYLIKNNKYSEIRISDLKDRIIIKYYK